MRTPPAPRPSLSGLGRFALLLAVAGAGACAPSPEEAAPPPKAAPPTPLAEDLPELQDEVRPDLVETRPIDEQEVVLAQPVLIDAKVEDGNEGAESAGEPRFNSDSPYQGQGTNADIGVGGGAGGLFGGRMGGHRNLRAEGGGGILLGGRVGGNAGTRAALGPREGGGDGTGGIGGSVRIDREGPSTESYDVIEENPFRRPTGEQALSTFSIDVDTASYAIVRRFLQQDGRRPPKGAVRIEEMVNYFPYAHAPPTDGRPFAVHVDAAAAPWNPRHRLVRIALKGREVDAGTRPAANLVFLLDVSGSMKPANKLPLVKRSIALLVGELQARDRVALVVYAGASGMVLPSTPGDRKAEILAALERLGAGGSTNGGAGIELAYRTAEENFIPGGINRVVLATDGDFNVGVTNGSDLVDLIREKAKSKVFLTALGYGMGNLKDTTLELLADKGNGNYGYVDSLREARKVLVEQGMSTLHTIAKDVKIQVDFNAARVAAYRLLGYENRILAARDFDDDRKDAGEIGAGHTVTALYEVVPAGLPVPGAVEPSKYAAGGDDGAIGAAGSEMLTVRLRYKEPEGDASTRFDVPFVDGGGSFDAAPEDLRFAASVALFGMVLRGSEHCGGSTLAAAREIAAGALGEDPGGYRREFLSLVDRAAGM